MREDRVIKTFSLPRKACILGLIPMFGLLVAGGLEAAQPSWSDPTGYPNSMPVYLKIKDSEGNNVSNTNSILGVFDGPNLVGRLKLFISPSGLIFMGTVYASQPAVTGLIPIGQI